MADYPRTLPMHIQTVNKIVDRAMVTELRGGGVKVRRLFSSQRRAFRVVHHGLNITQRTTLENFPAANRSLVFTLYVPKPTVPTTWTPYQVVWVDSEIDFTDEGNRLTGCALMMRAT